MSSEHAQTPDFFDELRLRGTLTLAGTAVLEGENMWFLSGNLSGTQVLTCSRTLEPFEQKFETPFAIRVVWPSGATAQELTHDDDWQLFVYRVPLAQDYVDVTECVRQLVILQEPMHPVKDPSKDFFWETGAPAQAPVEGDPRWEKLKALKCKMENPKGDPA